MPSTSLSRRLIPSCVRAATGETATARSLPAGATPRTAPAALPVWQYDPRRHGSAAAFARHPDFQQFREHVTALVHALSTLVEDCPTSVSNLRTFLTNVTTVDADGRSGFLADEAAQFYADGIGMLDRLVRLIQDPQADRTQARAEILDLSASLARCRVAVWEELPLSVRRLSPAPQALPAKWHDAKVKIVEQSAAETLRLSELKTTNRHAINALLPVLYKDAELPDKPSKDPYVRKDLSKSLVKEARRRLAEDLHPAAVSTLIADEYLACLGTRIQKEEGAASSAHPLTLSQMDKAIDALSAEFGTKPPCSAAFTVDRDDGSCKVATDVTLLAAHFLDCWRKDLASRKQDEASRPVPVGRPPEGTLLLRAGRLAWAVTHGTPRLLELDDLSALKPDELPVPALISVIRNSAPDDLWTSLPGEWMRDKEAFGALLDRIDDTALKACFERWQSSPTKLTKEQQVLLRDTLLDRQRGAALFEGATLAWQRLTLPGLEDLDGMRALYRQNQLGKVASLSHRLVATLRAATSRDLFHLAKVVNPEESLGISGWPIRDWLFAAAEALSSNPPLATIDDISQAIRAMAPAEQDQYSPLGAQAVYELLYSLVTATVLGPSQQSQNFSSEHARRLLHDFLNLDVEGRSRFIQSAWSSNSAYSDKAFFIYLEYAVRAMARYGCNWSELMALTKLSGSPRGTKAAERLKYVRAFIRTRAYPDGPVQRDHLPENFSEIPTARLPNPEGMWTALPAEGLRDAAMFESLLDRMDDVALVAHYDRWQRSPAPLNKGEQVLLRGALLRRGRGAPLFEGATLTWQRLTRPDLHDIKSLDALYRLRRTGELTPALFGERLAAAWTASHKIGLLGLLEVAMPGSSREARLRECGRFATQWLFAAARALSSDLGQVTIEEIADAVGSGTQALTSQASKADHPFGIVAASTAIICFSEDQVTWGDPKEAQRFEPGHAAILLRRFLDVDAQGRSRLLQGFWWCLDESNFFSILETTLRALVKHGSDRDELNAILSFEDPPATPAMSPRLAHTRAFICRLSQEGPPGMDLLPKGFSRLPVDVVEAGDDGLPQPQLAQALP